MLRDGVYSFNFTELLDILRRFDFVLPDQVGGVFLVRFEVISPDSFIWQLEINDRPFYLYAEDFVPSLDYVRSVFKDLAGERSWKLVPVREQLDIAHASPVQSASAYIFEGQPEELSLYAVESGYDFIFLAALE